MNPIRSHLSIVSQVPHPNVSQSSQPQEAEQNNEQLLHTVLNNLAQGVLLFDSTARLIFCNHPYIKMYGLSEEVAKPGCTLQDLVRHLLQMGNFANDAEDYIVKLMKNVA
jgi:PAS domain-containing protein